MKKGLIVAALMGLVVFAGCWHNAETPAADSSSSSSNSTAPATTPATESTTN